MTTLVNFYRRGTFHVSMAFIAMSSLLMQSCTTKPSTSQHTEARPSVVRTIPLAGGGHVTVERTTEYGEKGEIVTLESQAQTGYSLCIDKYVGSYDELFALFSQLKKAVIAKDRKSVAGLMRFPLEVNGLNGRSKTIKNSSQFLQQYEQVFNNMVSQRISESSPEAIMCNSDYASFGNGVVWGRAGNGKAGIDVVNLELL